MYNFFMAWQTIRFNSLSPLKELVVFFQHNLFDYNLFIRSFHFFFLIDFTGGYCYFFFYLFINFGMNMR